MIELFFKQVYEIVAISLWMKFFDFMRLVHPFVYTVT